MADCDIARQLQIEADKFHGPIERIARAYSVTNTGQTTIPEQLINAWGIGQGDEVEITDFGKTAAFYPEVPQSVSRRAENVIYGGLVTKHNAVTLPYEIRRRWGFKESFTYKVDIVSMGTEALVMPERQLKTRIGQVGLSGEDLDKFMVDLYKPDKSILKICAGRLLIKAAFPEIYEESE